MKSISRLAIYLRKIHIKILYILPLILVSSLFSVDYTLYGTIGEGSQGAPSTSLVVINQNTGSVEEIIGEIGYRVNGLSYDPTTGNLYATTSTNDPNFPTGLILINRETGQGTEIGSMNTTDQAVVCLTCNDSGQLYGWEEPNIDGLAAVDKNSGNITPLGASGLSTWELSLDFNEAGVLYLFNDTRNIYTINLSTGVDTLVGSYDPPGNPYPFDAAHHGKFNPVTWDLWAITEWGNNNPREIAIINVNTGLVNSLPTADNLHTLAFVPELPENQFSLTGKKKCDQFLTETDYFNLIEWTFGPGTVGGFKVYRKSTKGNVLIATLPGTARKYIDYNRKKNGTDEYITEIIGLDGTVIQSLSIKIGPI